MERTQMSFGEVLDTARNRGFELYDARGLPVDPELDSPLEDENLTAAPVRMSIRQTPGHQKWGMVANIAVGDQLFCLWGRWSRVSEFEHLVTDSAPTIGQAPQGR